MDFSASLVGRPGVAGKGFGYSGLQDVLMVLVHESCTADENFPKTGNLYRAEEGRGMIPSLNCFW